MLKDFYTEPGGNGSDPNKYEVWISVRMQGPGFVPGSTKEDGMYVDRGLLVRKPRFRRTVKSITFRSKRRDIQ